MEFILNSDPLPIDSLKFQKKAQGIQYYQWQYKQKLLKEEQQQKMLEEYLSSVQKEEEQPERRTFYHKKRNRDQGTFYEYNIKWKKKIESKIQKQKVLKNEQLSKIQQKQMKQQARQTKKQMLKQYKGPIEGWQQHFQNYLKIKSIGLTYLPEQITFQPKINSRSKKIAEGMSGKVEDRLMLFGQFLKMKLKQQQLNKNSNSIDRHVEKTKKKQKSCSYYFTQQQLFNRLFKDGEQAVKKKKQVVLNENYTFKPKINKLSEEQQNKIMKLRKPLYYIKEVKYKENSEGNEKKAIKPDFQAFLKRNQALVDIKKKLLEAMKDKMNEKQNIQRSKCTFTPSLNSNSKRINKSIKDTNRELQQQKQSQLKLPLYQESHVRENHMENIDLSKLTIREQKDQSRFDESDSLTYYRVQSQSKQHQKEEKKNESVKNQQRYTNTKKEQNSIVKINEEDSIQNMKNYEWETQLQQIENHLQNMMTRATK